MALGGDDLVFGVEWLKHLGLITTDYSSITMSFTWGNELVELQGCTGPDPTELTHTQVKHLLHIDRVAAFFHIQLALQSNNTPTDMWKTTLQLKETYLDSYHHSMHPWCPLSIGKTLITIHTIYINL